MWLEQFGQRAAQRGDGGPAAFLEGGGEFAQLAGPGGGADEFERGLLQRAGDEEAVHGLDGSQPFQGRAARGEGADPQAGRGGLGERAHVHHHAVRVVGGQRCGERGCVRVDQAAGEVVLDDERPGGPRDPQHLAAACGGEHGSGRVLEQRLADEGTGAGGGEGLGEQVRPYAVAVHRYRDGPQAGRAGDGQRAGVGR